MDIVFDIQAARGPIPVRVIAASAGRPVVLFLHGFSVDKETHRREAESLAEAGFAAVLPDAPHHGARRSPVVDELLAATGAAAHRILLRIVTEAVDEVPTLVDHFLGAGHPSVAIAGISMGAFTALGAAARDRRLSPIVSILGSPDWSPPYESAPADLQPILARDPRSEAARFPPRPLLVINAGLDRSVPPGPAREFAQTLAPAYAASPDRLVYREYPHSDHFVREEDWADLWRTTVDFLSRFTFGSGAGRSSA